MEGIKEKKAQSSCGNTIHKITIKCIFKNSERVHFDEKMVCA